MKKIWISLLLVLALVLTGCQIEIVLVDPYAEGWEEPQPIAQELIIHYIDVGQADCALVECQGEYLLIDGGNVADSRLVVAYLQEQGVETLNAVICTHAHEDHVGGLPGVLAVFPTLAVYAPTRTYASTCFDSFLRYVDQQGLEVILPQPGMVISLGDARVELLGPRKSYEQTNDTSIVCKVSYGSTSFLFTGDMERLAEDDLMAAGTDVTADVLKVGHHGSNTSSGYRFLYEVNPRYAVISVGSDNTYGHPHWEPLERLEQAGVTMLRTDKLGTIRAVSDGEEIAFFWTNQNAVPDNAEFAPGIYIGNIKSGTFHDPNCENLPSRRNRIELPGYREAIAEGYVPCHTCLGG